MNANEMLEVLRRVLLLDKTVFQQVRDDPALTGPAAGGAAIAVLIAGFGAWLYGQTVWNGVGFGFFDTVILGTLFTIILLMAGFGITYVVLIQALRIDIAPDALVRLLAVGHLPYALGLLVCIPDLGYAFGAAVDSRRVLVDAVRAALRFAGGERAEAGGVRRGRNGGLDGDHPVHLGQRQRVRDGRLRLRAHRVIGLVAGTAG